MTACYASANRIHARYRRYQATQQGSLVGVVLACLLHAPDYLLPQCGQALSKLLQAKGSWVGRETAEDVTCNSATESGSPVRFERAAATHFNTQKIQCQCVSNNVSSRFNQHLYLAFMCLIQVTVTTNTSSAHPCPTPRIKCCQGEPDVSTKHLLRFELRLLLVTTGLGTGCVVGL